VARKIKELIIHHSASFRLDTTISKIKRWHIEGRRWPHIGYHYVIQLDGIPVSTLSDKKCGFGVYGKNANAIHICLVGNFDKELPTPFQLENLKKLLIKLCKKYGLFSWGIFGHCNIALPNYPTACPGKYLLEQLSGIKQVVMKEVREDGENKEAVKKESKEKQKEGKEKLTEEKIIASFGFFQKVRHYFERMRLWIREKLRRDEKWTSS